MRLFIFIVCFLSVSTVFAEDSVSGYIGLGGFFFNTDDHTIVDGKSNNIHRNRYSEYKPLVMGEIKAKMSDRTVFHIGIPKEALSPEMSAGIESTFDDGTKVDASAIYALMQKAWKNPYADNREETDQKSYGGSLTFRNINGSGVFTEIKMIRHTVEDDEAAKLFDTLDRNGTATSVKAGYDFMNNGIMASYFMELGRDNARGSAESSNFLGIGLMGTRKVLNNDDLTFVILGKDQKYDRKNPYYADKRHDILLKALASYTINDPLGYKNKFVKLSAGYGKTYSTVNFYESSTYLASIMAGANF